jgi:hypothetical protein
MYRKGVVWQWGLPRKTQKLKAQAFLRRKEEEVR